MQGRILVELQEHMGSDASIANAAWVSTYDKNRREDKYDDQKRISEIVQRLIREGHNVPLESVVMRFWIRMPIFADRQHMTHRIGSHNGLSGRYRTMPLDWFPVPEDVVSIFDAADQKLVQLYKESCEIATKNYETTILLLKSAESSKRISNKEFKRAREIARAQLPVSGMIERTSIFNLRSFANYQFLRNSSHAQEEIRVIAKAMLEEVKLAAIAPIAISTLEGIGWKI